MAGLFLVIPQNGEIDGTEVTMDISNFEGVIDTSSLEAGRTRFSLRYDDVRKPIRQYVGSDGVL